MCHVKQVVFTLSYLLRASGNLSDSFERHFSFNYFKNLSFLWSFLNFFTSKKEKSFPRQNEITFGSLYQLNSSLVQGRLNWLGSKPWIFCHIWARFQRIQFSPACQPKHVKQVDYPGRCSRQRILDWVKTFGVLFFRTRFLHILFRFVKKKKSNAWKGLIILPAACSRCFWRCLRAK